MVVLPGRCDIGATVSPQSKRLIWHFNAVDRPGTLRYANRLYRRDHVNAGRRFTPDRTGDPTAVAAVIDHRRCVARLAGTIDAQAAGLGADERCLGSGDVQVRPGCSGDGRVFAGQRQYGHCRSLPSTVPWFPFQSGRKTASDGPVVASLAFESATGAAAGVVQLQRHHRIGDDVLREVLGKLDLSEADLGVVK